MPRSFRWKQSEQRREGWTPCEVRAQTGPARATTPAVARTCRRATTAVDAWAKAYPLGRRRLCPGGNACAQRQCMLPSDNVCACATMSATGEGCFFTKTPHFGAQATTSALARRLLACAFMIRAGFAHPNCKYDKKDFLKKLQWRKF